MSDLSRFITGYCTLWKTIGLKLGLQNTLLNLIEREHLMQFRECFRITLQYWLDQNVSTTWSTLELAITNARREELYLDNLPESKIVWVATVNNKTFEGEKFLQCTGLIHS